MVKAFVVSYDDSIFLDESELKGLIISSAAFRPLPIEDCLNHGVLPLDHDEQNKVLTAVVASPMPLSWLREIQNQYDLSVLSIFRTDQLFIKKYLMHIKNWLDPDWLKEPAAHTIMVQDLLAGAENSSQGIVVIVDSDRGRAEYFEGFLNQNGVKTSLFDSRDSLEEFVAQQEAALVESDELFEPSQNPGAVSHILIQKEMISETKRPDLVKRLHGLMPKTRINFFETYKSLLLRGLDPIATTGTYELKQLQSNLKFFIENHDYYHASLEYIKKGELIEAIGFLKQVPSDDLNYRKAQYILGKAFSKKKNYKKAVQCFQRALEPNPSETRRGRNLKILFFLGLAHEKTKQYPEALSYYEQVFAENGSYRDIAERLDRCRKEVAAEAMVQEKKEGVTPFSQSSSQQQHRYELIQEIGRGGMGVIYRARDTSLDREVALKVLSSTLKTDPKVIATFIREAKSCAALNHINIVTVYDAGIDENGNYFIAMEFIRGKTIREILKVKQKFSLQSTAKICRQVCRGLRYAHKHHIVHRDLTTNNMMLTENRIIKIMDFGLARIVEHLHSEQSIIGGTPFFMSPEQVEGASIDHRTDIYSLGICLFEISTGRVPFPGENPGYHHVHTPAPDPQLIIPDLPEWLRTIILKCMEKKPESRFQNVDEILDLIPSDL